MVCFLLAMKILATKERRVRFFQQRVESTHQNLDQTGITSGGWIPVLTQQPRVVYSMQPTLPVSNITTTPAIVIVSQVQAQPIVCQPQITQVPIQQPLVSTAPPQSQISASLTRTTQAQTGVMTPHLGQSSSIRQ